MSHWNHRVWKDTNGFFSIRETYYDDDGEIVGFDASGKTPEGFDLEELQEDYTLMAEAFRSPVLLEEEHEGPVAQRLTKILAEATEEL